MDAVLKAFIACERDVVNALTSVIDAVYDEEEDSTLTQGLLAPSDEDDPNSFNRFVDVNDIFTKEMESRAKELLTFGVNYQLSHRGFDSISATGNITSVLGMSLTEFSSVFSMLEDELKNHYKHSRSTRDFTSCRPSFCDNRFRLFTVLYRCKLGCSFRSMEPVFGWSSSTMEEWFNDIVSICHVEKSHLHSASSDSQS